MIPKRGIDIRDVQIKIDAVRGMAWNNPANDMTWVLDGGVPCGCRANRVEMNGDQGVAWNDPANDMTQVLDGGVPCGCRVDRVEMNGDQGVAWNDPDNDVDLGVACNNLPLYDLDNKDQGVSGEDPVVEFKEISPVPNFDQTKDSSEAKPPVKAGRSPDGVLQTTKNEVKSSTRAQLGSC